MDVVGSLADRVTVLHYGEVLTEGTFAEVKRDPARVRSLPGERRDAVLEVDGIHTYYGESHVLHGVSLRVGAGEAVALLGRNGAGKTTLIRSIVGFTPPRAGRVRLRRRSRSRRWPAHRIARRGIALVPQGRRIFAPLTRAREPDCWARAPDGWTLERVYALFPRLRERARPGGRHALGRRAADAGHRPRAHDQRPPAPAGRAVGGPGAAHRARDRADRARRSRASGSPSCSSSRTTTWRCGWPTACT